MPEGKQRKHKGSSHKCTACTHGPLLMRRLTAGFYNGKIYQFGTVFYYSKGSSAVFVPVPVIKGVINGKRV